MVLRRWAAQTASERQRFLKRARLLVIGPTPPPYFGPALSTQTILSSPLLDQFEVLHLDTSDRRSPHTINTLDGENVRLALLHGARFVELLRTRRPHLVYLPISQAPLGYLRDCLFLLPARLLGVRTVVHLRGGAFQQFYRSSTLWLRSLIRFSLSGVRRAIVLTPRLRSEFAGLVPAARVSVVPNGVVDLRAAATALDKAPGAPLQTLFLSNMRAKKGPRVAQQAALEALRHHPTLRFVFAGAWESESMREAFLQPFRSAGFHERVACLDSIHGEAKTRLMLASDIFLMTPIAPEGQPRVLLEAMCFALPIVATDQGGISETVEDGANGFVVPSGDPLAVAQRVLQLANDPDLRRGMAQSSRQRYLNHFTAEASNQRLATELVEVLRER